MSSPCSLCAFASITALPARIQCCSFLGLKKRHLFSVVALASPEQGKLEAEFFQHVALSGHSWPLDGRKPTPLMPPSTVVKVQMEALMRNDWPDDDSGLKTAFDFTMPFQAEQILSAKMLNGLASAMRVRAWDAGERYVNSDEFVQFFKDSAYAPLLNCSQWKMASPVIFYGPGDRRALQAVKVEFTTSQGEPTTRAFTFCLRKVLVGAYKDCWLVVGARIGNHTCTRM